MCHVLLQEALQGTPTPRRSRVSSIFQQKTIKQDDIDTDFLKHVAFAAQRSSPSLPAPEVHSVYQQADQAAISKFVASPAAVQLANPDSPLLADMQPADPGEFTLAKIEQSIAEIEAELGWASESAAVSAAASNTMLFKSPLAPPSILSSSHTGRPHATSISSTGTAALHALYSWHCITRCMFHIDNDLPHEAVKSTSVFNSSQIACACSHAQSWWCMPL